MEEKLIRSIQNHFFPLLLDADDTRLDISVCFVAEVGGPGLRVPKEFGIELLLFVEFTLR